MKMQIVNPIRSPGWDPMLLASGDRSFFHTSAWAKTLVASYGFRPRYFATYSGDTLTSLMPFMEVNSFITGKRGVSLPFSDQCQAFTPEQEHIQAALEQVLNFGQRAGWKYAEWRGAHFSTGEGSAYERYYIHEIDLSKDENLIYSGFKDNNRRSIKKALNEGVSVIPFFSMEAVRIFYNLNCVTRRRHGLPPQPYGFFRNLYTHVIRDGYGSVFIAKHSGKAIAAAIFVYFDTHAIFKYGASDMRYQSLRPNNLIFWEAIKWLRSKDITVLNLGRTEIDNLGLLQYKRLWGAKEFLTDYRRYHFGKRKFLQGRGSRKHLYNAVLARLPIGVLKILGSVLYRHVG